MFIEETQDSVTGQVRVTDVVHVSNLSYETVACADPAMALDIDFNSPKPVRESLLSVNRAQVPIGVAVNRTRVAQEISLDNTLPIWAAGKSEIASDAKITFESMLLSNSGQVKLTLVEAPMGGGRWSGSYIYNKGDTVDYVSLVASPPEIQDAQSGRNISWTPPEMRDPSLIKVAVQRFSIHPVDTSLPYVRWAISASSETRSITLPEPPAGIDPMIQDGAQYSLQVATNILGNVTDSTGKDVAEEYTSTATVTWTP